MNSWLSSWENVFSYKVQKQLAGIIQNFGREIDRRNSGDKGGERGGGLTGTGKTKGKGKGGLIDRNREDTREGTEG